MNNPGDRQPTCPRCGYSLSPSAGKYCNHCGFELQAHSVPPPGSDYFAPVAYPPQPQARRGLNPGCIVGIVLAILLPGFLVLAAIALPNYIKVKEKAKEAESKSDLHRVQLAVERYAVDHEAEYPRWLIGGSTQFANDVVLADDDSAFRDIESCPVRELVSDPLLREGYLQEYPVNPFVRSGVAIHQVQCNLPSAETGDDPLANTYQDGYERGTRFGPRCNLLGNCLADARFEEFTLVHPQTGESLTEYTFADVEYEFWDMWTGDDPEPFLPGMFFYKSSGPVESMYVTPTTTGPRDRSFNAPAPPSSIDHYIMGSYGGVRTKGKDILGEERPVIFEAPDPNNEGQMQQVEFWTWTRSEVSDDPADRMGCPYSPRPGGGLDQPLDYGNPNGIRDALILVLTDGS